MFPKLKAWVKQYAVGIAWSLAFSALLLKAILSYANLQYVARTAEQVTNQYEVLLELEFIVGALLDAETGERGYVITGQSEYLEHYERALAALPEHLAKTDAFFREDPKQTSRFRRVRDLVRARLDELKKVIELRKENFPAAQKRMLEHRGKHTMDSIRAAVAEIRDEERRILQERRNEAEVGRQNAGLILMAGSIVLAMMTVAAFFVVHRQLRYRSAMEKKLTAVNEELEQRVIHRTDMLRTANEDLRAEIEERTRLEEHAKLAAEELQRSNRELEQFAFVASHDLQEPLRKIQAFSDRLKTKYRDKIDDQGKEYIERIVSSADRMRALIQDLLTFSRVSTKGKDFTPVDLNRVVQDVLTDLEGRLIETSGTVETAPLPTVLADGSQMGQLFLNLIANALKFQRPNVPPVVRVAAREVPAESDGLTQWEITVADNGIGFDNAYADRIFQLFQRLHGRSEYEGTGMGLAICKKIVERHGGTIKANGVPGEGATITVTFPRPADPQPE